MKTMLKLAIPLIALLALAGCESDSVTPNDPAPNTDTPEAISHQAAALATALNDVAPIIIDPQKGFTFNFTGEIDGSVDIQYYIGGVMGAPTDVFADCDYGTMTTGAAPLTFFGEILLALNLNATISPAVPTATINGTASIDSPDLTRDFLLWNLVVTEDGFINSGTLSTEIPESLMEVEIVFTGHEMVNIYVGEVLTYLLNLNTGEVTEVD